MIKKNFFFFLTIFFFTPIVNATTYHVDSILGDNTNSGLSHNEAFQTIEALGSVLIGEGDSILFRGGQTYTGSLILSEVSATETSPVYIGTYGSDQKAIIDASESSRVIHISGESSHIYIENISMIGASKQAILVSGGNSEEIHLKNIMIDSSEGYGIYISSSASLSNSTFNDIYINQPKYDGVYITGSIENTLFEKIIILDAGRNGFSQKNTNFSSQFILKDAEILRSKSNGIYTEFIRDSSIIGGKVLHSGVNGIQLCGKNNISFTEIQGVRSNFNGKYGLFVSCGIRAKYEVHDSFFNKNGINGVEATGNSYITLYRTTAAENKNDGIGIHGSAGLFCNNCTLNRNGIDGIGSDGDGISYHNNSYGKLESSIIRDNKKSGITNVQSTNVEIIGNIFSYTTPGTLPLVGILHSSQAYINDNKLFNNSDSSVNTIGIQAQNETQVIIGDNIIQGFTEEILILE